MPSASSSDDILRKRFHIARLIVDGHNGGFPLSPSEIRDIVGVSQKTHRRDIKRAREAQTFDEWAPRQRGPAKGKRRVSTEVVSLAVEIVYEHRTVKRNVSKMARDLRHRATVKGIGLTAPTARRVIRDIYARDDGYLRAQEMGREGERMFELQRGSFSSSEPLEVVFIDHTPLDVRHSLFGDRQRAFRPTLTTASDLYSGALLAGFVSLFPPCRTTVALAMALLTADKTPLLRQYNLPGEWECGGVPRTIMVDGAKEFARDEFDWVCKRYDIELVVGGGRPERRSPHERIFRTLNSEVHTWPGTTLSNSVELKKHGGARPIELDFQDVQYRLLIAIMEYNHETYDGSDLAPMAAWRNAIGDVSAARRPIRNSRHVFLDFLPSEERALTGKGIVFERCAYRSSELQKLRYDGVKNVKFHYDPRNMRQIYLPVPDERQYVPIERMTPADAPEDLYLLRAYNSDRRGAAEASRDKALLAELHAAKRKHNRYFRLFSDEFFDDPPPKKQVAAAPILEGILDPENETHREGAPRQGPLLPLQIPDFPSRMK